MPSAAPWKPYHSTYIGDGLASLTFDPYADLLWLSNTAGTVISHLLPNSLTQNQDERRLDRYTSFKSHSYPSTSSQLIVTERGVLSLGDRSVKLTNRRGLPLCDLFQDANSLAFTSPRAAEFVVGGSQPRISLMNAYNGTVVRLIELADQTSTSDSDSRASISPGFSPITHIRRSQSLICFGSRSGNVSLRDPATLREEHSMMAHYAGLEQLETEGNYLVTCGYSLKQGHPVRDPLVKVFDLRALKPLPPVSFPSIPALVRFHPRMLSTLFITSSLGQLQVLDLANPLPSSSFYQLDVNNFVTDLCISSSGEGIAYTEAGGMLHLWTTLGGTGLRVMAEEEGGLKPMKWSRASQPVEVAPPMQLPPKIDWNDETPLSSIGMPYYSTELLSVFPYENYLTEYSPLLQPRPVIDPDLSVPTHSRNSQFSKVVGGVFDGGGSNGGAVYLSNPKKSRRYQASLPTRTSNLFSTSVATARVGNRPSHSTSVNSDFKRKLSIPLFRSEKAKSKNLTWDKRTKEKGGDDVQEVRFDLNLEGSEEMPRWYRLVEIKYSKFGIEDFDFGYYNSTRYSGLETHIVNSYTNSLLQVVYHTIPVRRVAESHITLGCSIPNCMLCELGFLFRMMGDAKGVNCQTTNFSKAFSINQKAIALELMDHQHQDFCLNQNQALVQRNLDSNHPKPISISNKSYAALIQLCHHFLLDQISDDSSKVSGDKSLRFTPMSILVKTTKTSTSLATISNQIPASPIMDIYSMRWQTTQTCSSCQHQTSRTTFTKVIEMIYPRRALSNEPKPLTDFCSILRNSMIRDTTAKSMCGNCNQHCHQRWRRSLDDEGTGNRSLPSVLAINAGVTNSDQLDVWLDASAKTVQPMAADGKKLLSEDVNPRFLQPQIGISTRSQADDKSNSKITIMGGNLIEGIEEAVRYELRGMIIQIQSDDELPHLVSLIKIQEELSSEKDDTKCGRGGSGWYLFNDFLVRKVSEEEALSFPACWKIPCVLYYVREDFSDVLDLSRLPSKMDQSILFKDINLSRCRDVSKIRHEVLTEEELPKKGDMVAIDAEFVSLQQEEVDYRSDGTRIVRRPSRMTLARVSVLRGEGAKTGVPFIDDHIQTFEPITDYLTEFSGIRRLYRSYYKNIVKCFYKYAHTPMIIPSLTDVIYYFNPTSVINLAGDLDETVSPHTLVPLKVAYKKLRVLVDLGCIFIGHGLSKDFRIINIHVPPAQIIDTVDLYYISSRQRKLSLRLLSYLILKHDIQNAGTHDSIEDARTALQLYDIYRQLQNEGVWKEELENVYRKGREMGWKVSILEKATLIEKQKSTFPSKSNDKSKLEASHSPINKDFSTVTKSLESSHAISNCDSRLNSTSTLSASSATYFPLNLSGSQTQKLMPSRLPPPFRPRAALPLSDTLDPALSVSNAAPPKALLSSPPSFEPQNKFGITDRSKSATTPKNSADKVTNLSTINSTTTFHRYMSTSPPVFEPKKKKSTVFNPMAPSFVKSSPIVGFNQVPTNKVPTELSNGILKTTINQSGLKSPGLSVIQPNNSHNGTLNEFYPAIQALQNPPTQTHPPAIYHAQSGNHHIGMSNEPFFPIFSSNSSSPQSQQAVQPHNFYNHHQAGNFNNGELQRFGGVGSGESSSGNSHF
ncbi:PAB-dependent poly(A)-specific ribonuclease subunit 2 [Phakopsora pachyrhizi]|uniref:PAN2-PAN3 deadenylation complex catalytic subunit PAN2 n=1 Tax=Phakopsora pachyrhizi TaxID=170000 RepID=A0AAV0BTV2_PHAPC|nr:PAB-dependent poly(A)-specific ribonuclease subunit 2 [Phakopsora pachyrhizi]